MAARWKADSQGFTRTGISVSVFIFKLEQLQGEMRAIRKSFDLNFRLSIEIESRLSLDSLNSVSFIYS